MRALFLHSNRIKVIARQKALKEADQLEKPEFDVNKEHLAVFVAVEHGDNLSVAEQLVEEIKKVLEKIGIKEKVVVLYPYVHLTNNPSSPKLAKEVLDKAYDLLKSEGFEVYKAPFGWYKEFEIHVKGHPLAELSRTIKPKKVKKEEGNKVYLIYDGEKEYIIVGKKDKILVKDYKEIENKEKLHFELPKDGIELPIPINQDFEKMVLKEVFSEGEEIEKNPLNDVAKKFGFEWEPLSDYGHMRYKPYAALMVDLVNDYSIKIAKELPFPVFIVKGTNMFDLKQGPVAEHAKLFGERMYEVQSDKSVFVLRYAACFQQFAIAKDLTLSYKNVPFGMLEVADSYRFEQPGEVVLAFRLRKFYMPDLHVFTKDLDEAVEQFLNMHKKIMEEIKKIGRDYELLINVASFEDYEKYKYIIEQIYKDVKKPLLLAIYPKSDQRYWIINIEYHIIDVLGRPREIGTTQIDLHNSKRFGIKYIDKDGSEKHVIILHNAILGSIERYIYALFDTALRKEKPVLPFWISPVQVRVIPVSEKYLEYAEQIAKELESKFRVELDDRDETLNKKIKDAESLWVPYIIVIGEKEIKNNKITVRDRYENKVYETSLEDLISKMEELQKGYPFRPLYGPMKLSLKPANL